ncbi:conserved Plasmodium protein, unknown function [Plasmodium ovale curtisi]|uniref:Uncharacterized protein n=1 Tax=Plasmodium ovale curtisi TaxID=864141 RepID=A0A1A8VM45_PLAOA|nr:conserved Plasmodium protein, unknown function [Plasmodium ovale curtisi]SBS81037.1 conserved Plasmodium protein, unknown function [Plasmodium ovale curtisi]
MLLTLGMVALLLGGQQPCVSFFYEKTVLKKSMEYPFRVYVSKPAQKKSNQLKTKIIINKRKKEENEKKKSYYKNEFKSSPKYKMIEDIVEGYPYELPPISCEKEPFILLKNKIKGEHLKGYELPFGFIEPVKYEILKLIGKICDPFKPLCCYSLTPRLFISKLFSNKYKITYDEFCYKIEYKMTFYMPSYTELYKYEKELLWQQWIAVRNLKEVTPQTDIDDNNRVERILKEDEITLPIVMLKVNSEINNQGIHPSILRMFFNFLNVSKNEKGTEEENTLIRNYAFLKLETIKNKIKNRDYLEGIRPDYLYLMFKEIATKYYNDFNEKNFKKEYNDAINYNDIRQKIISQNSIYKKERKLFSEQTKKTLLKFYDIQLPSFFNEYCKKKKENYKLIQDKIGQMIQNKYKKRKQKRDNTTATTTTELAPVTQSETSSIGDEYAITTTTNEQTETKKKKKKKKKK